MAFGNNHWSASPNRKTTGYRQRDERERQEAAAFLRWVLEDGPQSVSEVIRIARAAGVTPWKVGYAQSKMGVAIAYREGDRGRRMWRLPP